MLKRALVWHDGSVDALFEDNSFINIQDHMNMFYYVPGNGVGAQKLFTSFATNTTYRYQSTSSVSCTEHTTENIRDKLLELLHFVNSHTAEPYLCRPNIPVSESDIFERDVAIENVSWTMKSEFVQLLHNGGIKVISEDNLARLILSPNGRSFKVVFPARVYSSGVDSDKSKMEYTFISQFFSKGSFPSEWEIPLMIALYYYLSYHHEKDQRMLAVLRSKLDMDSSFAIQLPRTKSPLATTGYYCHSYDTDYEGSLESEKDVVTRAKIITALDSSRGIQESITSGSLKNGTGISLEYIASSRIIFRYFCDAQNAELSFIQRTTCLLLKNRPEPHCIQYDYEQKPIERVYIISGIVFPSSRTTENKHDLFDALDTVKYLVNFRERAAESWLFTSQRPPLSLSQKKPLSDMIVIEQICNDMGKFTLYSNNQIRCAFSDRTILTVLENGLCNVITREGEILKTSIDNHLSSVEHYLTEAIAFGKWVRRSDQEKQEEMNRKERNLELQNTANTLIDRSQILLKIVENASNQ